MDLATGFSAATSAVTMTKEFLKIALDAKVDTEAKIKVQEAREKLNEIQDVIYTLKDELFKLQDNNRELQLKLEQTNRDAELLNNYELSTTAGGATVYKYKKTPEHFACPNCFSNRKVQILQTRNTIGGHYSCSGCDKLYPIEKPSDDDFSITTVGSRWEIL